MNEKMIRTLILVAVVLGVGFYYMFGLNKTVRERPVVVGDMRMLGTITKEPMVRKKDTIIEGAYDYYFEVTEDELYYIYIEKSNVNEELLELFVDEEVTIRGYVAEGQWDSDDPEVASRVGSYIVIKNIFK